MEHMAIDIMAILCEITNRGDSSESTKVIRIQVVIPSQRMGTI